MLDLKRYIALGKVSSYAMEHTLGNKKPKMEPIGEKTWPAYISHDVYREVDYSYLQRCFSRNAHGDSGSISQDIAAWNRVSESNNGVIFSAYPVKPCSLSAQNRDTKVVIIITDLRLARSMVVLEPDQECFSNAA
jgi:hypothetical protein